MKDEILDKFRDIINGLEFNSGDTEVDDYGEFDVTDHWIDYALNIKYSCKVIPYDDVPEEYEFSCQVVSVEINIHELETDLQILNPRGLDMLVCDLVEKHLR